MTPESLEEFLDRLDLYGGNLETWPDEARDAAQALLSASPEARAHLSAMRRAEATLAQTRATHAKGVDDLTFRVMQMAQARPHTAIRRLPWAVAGMMALAAGLYVGALPRMSEGPSEIVTAALDQSGGHDVW